MSLKQLLQRNYGETLKLPASRVSQFSDQVINFINFINFINILYDMHIPVWSNEKFTNCIKAKTEWKGSELETKLLKLFMLYELFQLIILKCVPVRIPWPNILINCCKTKPSDVKFLEISMIHLPYHPTISFIQYFLQNTLFSIL